MHIESLRHERHKNISIIDYKLCSHFVDVHKRQFDVDGQAIINELKAFQNFNLKANLFCKNIYDSLSAAHYRMSIESQVLKREEHFEKTEFNSEFTLSGQDCFLMAVYIQELQNAIAAQNYEACCEMSCPSVKLNKAYCKSKCSNCIGNNIPYSVLHHDFLRDL